MKKLFSLFTLLVAIVMGAWADNIYSFGFNQAILDAYDSEGTLLSSPSHDGAVIDISSTYNSCGDAYVTSASAKEKCLSISNDASQNYDTYYLEIKSSEEIKNIYLVAAVTGSTSGSNAVIVGWKGTPSATIDEYQTFATPGKGATSGKEISITLAKSGIKCVRIYRKIKLDSSTKTTFTGSSATTIPSSASTYGISFIKVTTTPSGPVDPVFELSADEVEVGKTISVTGPNGLSFNAEPVSETTGAVSVDGGTITGVTAGAAQVRVTSDATDDYNAYDNTFDITVTAAKIATELSFGTPTTTVARGEEVTNAATLTAGGGAISGTVTYSSDNEAVATVDATGKVTGVKVGTANIKANFAGDATYSAAEEISYAIAVTLPALTAVDNKFWTSASLLSEAGGAKDYTTADVLDNMEIAGTSTALKITAGGDKTIDGQTFGGRVRFGKDGTAAGNYLHFMVKPNTKITMWGIRATAGAESNGLALCVGEVGGSEEEVYSFAGGDVEYMTYIYTGSEDADMYAYSKATAGASMMAIKVEPIQSTTINLNSKGYATYSSKYDFTFDGADAYGMKLTQTSLVGTKVISGKVKAGEGILFKGDAGATVTITETTGAEAIGDANNLIGTTNASEEIISSSYNYMYSLSGDTFMTFTGTLAANKAFFGSDTAIAASLDLVFDDEATAINGVNANENLNVNVPVKVIKNGQLVIETANGVFTAAGAQVK